VDFSTFYALFDPLAVVATLTTALFAGLAAGAVGVVLTAVRGPGR